MTYIASPSGTPIQLKVYPNIKKYLQNLLVKCSARSNGWIWIYALQHKTGQYEILRQNPNITLLQSYPSAKSVVLSLLVILVNISESCYSIKELTIEDTVTLSRGCIKIWLARNPSAKSVIVTVPLYLMQSFFIPKSIWFEIEKICLRFIWGDNDGRSLFTNLKIE